MVETNIKEMNMNKDNSIFEGTNHTDHVNFVDSKVKVNLTNLDSAKMCTD